MSGSSVVVDDNYIRESILNPQAKIAAGFQPIMPTFQGLVSEEQLLQLIAYVKSLSQTGAAPAPAVESQQSFATAAGSAAAPVAPATQTRGNQP